MANKGKQTDKTNQKIQDFCKALETYAGALNVTHGTELGNGLIEALAQLSLFPNSTLHLIDLMVIETNKKIPNDDIMEAYLLIYSIFLSEISYLDDASEKKKTMVEDIEEKIISLANSEEISSQLLTVLMGGLIDTNLTFSNVLREILDEAIMAKEDMQDVDFAESGNPFTDILQELDGDIFQLANFMLQSSEMMAPEVAEQMFAPMVFAQEEELREAVLGCLSSKQDYVRKALLAALLDAALQGHMTAVMLRRLITQRNWLPKEERAMTDKVIKACRKNKVDCAPWPKTGKIKEIWTSGIDGAGAMTMFIVVKEGRRHAMAMVLLKQGKGVRDSFVNHQMTLPQIRTMLNSVKEQLHLFKSDLAFISTALQAFLSLNLQSEEIPPYALLDVAESTGLSELNPADQSVKQLVNTLYSEGVKKWGEDRISEMVEKSEKLLEDHPITETWFIEGNAAEAIQQKNISDDKKEILLLKDAMEPKREWWAQQFAWMGIALLHLSLIDGCKKEENCNGWLDFIVIANKIFDGTALHDIPAMLSIAKLTLENDFLIFGDF